MSSAGSQYAFVIQTRDNRDRSWSWVTTYGNAGDMDVDRGVEDDAPGTPRAFGRARFDTYLDYLVAACPETVDYFLFEDQDDTEWRVLVWDVPATGYDLRSPVPPHGDRTRLGYALALAIEGGEPHATSTWSGVVVRKRLQAKRDAQEAGNPSGKPTDDSSG
ncbi:hypothetical protein [Streptosporangium sp. NPDC051022]|uniref:hypothetical protein n=1 Tax=Streptosporangium sp. NPDC051022 TaxID=3155752 RepID=UPI00341CB153